MRQLWHQLLKVSGAKTVTLLARCETDFFNKTSKWTLNSIHIWQIYGLIDYFRKYVEFLGKKLSLRFGGSAASWKASCGLMIPNWQNWSPHAKHLGRWHPATRLIAGQISGLSLMCRQGLLWSSALILNNLVLKGHQIIYNLYRPPLANSGSCNNSDGSVSGTEREREARDM